MSEKAKNLFLVTDLEATLGKLRNEKACAEEARNVAHQRAADLQAEVDSVKKDFSRLTAELHALSLEKAAQIQTLSQDNTRLETESSRLQQALEAERELHGKAQGALEAQVGYLKK